MKSKKLLKIYLLIRSFKNFKWLKKCLNSALKQDYKNFQILYVDDASNYTKNQKKYIIKKLKGHVVVFNKKRHYSLRNCYALLHKYAKDENAVIFNLDGDDWLYTKHALRTVAKVYKMNPNCQLTWGECLFWNGTELSKPSRFVKKFVNTSYPKNIVKENGYRGYYFLPLHPRTWRVSLFKSISKKDFLDSNGNWFKYPEDMIIFFPMLEMAKGNYKALKKPLYIYNISNPLSDSTKNTIGMLKGQLEVRKRNLPTKLIPQDYEQLEIRYNKFFSIPLIAEYLYKIQNSLLQKGFLKHIFLSLKYKDKAKVALKNGIKKNSIIILKTEKILHLIKEYKNNIIVFDNPKINIDFLNLESVYTLMWVLYYCDYTTKRTKYKINFLPDNFPVWNNTL